MTELIVVIDVGNSGAKIGAVRGDDVAGPMRLPRADARAVRDLAAPMLKGREAIIAISGSHPTKVKGLHWEVAKLRLGPTVSVLHDHAGIPAAQVDRPEAAGVDRRVQVLAAVHHAGEVAAVVSCGTAITVDIADGEGALLGGAILPGLGLGATALASGTARLPKIELAGPVTMPARDTEDALRAGLRLGAAGAIERLLLEAGVSAETPVYLTGQDAPHLQPHIGREMRSQPGLGILGVALAVRAAPPR